MTAPIPPLGGIPLFPLQHVFALFSPVIMYFSLQPSAFLINFLSYFATMCNRRYTLSFLLLFFSVSNCGHWAEKVLTLGSPILCYKPKYFRYLIGSCWKAPRYHPHFLKLNFASCFISPTLFLCAEEGDISNNSLLSRGGKKGKLFEIERMNVVFLMCLKIYELQFVTLSSSITRHDAVWISF